MHHDMGTQHQTLEPNTTPDSVSSRESGPYAPLTAAVDNLSVFAWGFAGKVCGRCQRGIRHHQPERLRENEASKQACYGTSKQRPNRD